MTNKAKLVCSVLVLTCLLHAAHGASVADERQHITFVRGRSTVVVKEQWREAIVDYYLRARANQRMFIKLSSPNEEVSFRIVRPSLVGGGSPTPFVNEKNNLETKGSYAWSGKLPETGEYMVEMFGPGKNIPYTLTVTIK